MASIAGITLLATGSVAFAQSGQNAQATTPTSSATNNNVTHLDNVIVTARRRAENLRDVPVAVVPITPEELRKGVVTDLSKIGEVAPQVVIGRGTSGTGALITIRGISSTQADAGVDQSVVVVVDGVPLSRGRIITTSLFDLEQIEVMQGPQALFFGKNSPAGVISLRSATPSDEFEGQVKLGYEFNARERYVEGAVSVPLTPTLGLRIAARGSEMDGWIHNVAQPTANPFEPSTPVPGSWDSLMPNGSNVSGRATLQWKPSERFDATLRLMHQQERINSDASTFEGFCIGSTTSPTELGVPEPGADCSANRKVSLSALPAAFAVNAPLFNGGIPYAKSEFTFGALNMNWNLEHLSVASTTGLYDQTIAGAHGADFSPFAQIFYGEREHYKVVTEEVRLNTDFNGPLNFMFGAYGESSTRVWRAEADVFNAYNPVTQNYTTAEPASNNDSDGYSVFAQGRWTITPSLEFTAGARYSNDTKKSKVWNESVNLNSATGLTLLPEGIVLNPRTKNNNVSPEVALTWKPSENQTLYGAYKTGYKAGGIANSVFVPLSATADSITFKNEKVDGFEIGYRADLLDQTLRLDLTAYDYNYKNLQVVSYDILLFLFRVLNAADAQTTGISGSFKWLATDNFSLNGNIGYNRARYNNFAGAQCYTNQTVAEGCINGSQDLSGRILNRAPRVTANLGFDYHIGLPKGWTMDLSGNAAYSASYQVAPDYDPAGFQSSYWLFNAGINLAPASGTYQISLIGRNLSDKSYMVYGASQAGSGNRDQYVGAFNRPREIVLELSHRF